MSRPLETEPSGFRLPTTTPALRNTTVITHLLIAGKRGGEPGNRTSDLQMLWVWEGCQAAQGAMKKIRIVPPKKSLSLGKKRRL